MELDAEQSGRRLADDRRSSLEEEKASGSDSALKYIDRCKKIGRVGPVKVMLDKKTAFGAVHFKTKENLDVECSASFASIRANTGVFSGRYYYEVLLKTNGLM
jgi:hypothetical protein